MVYYEIHLALLLEQDKKVEEIKWVYYNAKPSTFIQADFFFFIFFFLSGAAACWR